MLTVSKKKEKRKSNALYTQTAHARRNRELQQMTAMTMSLFLVFFMLFAVLFHSSASQ